MLNECVHTYVEKCTVLCLSKRLTMLRKATMHHSLEFQSSSLSSSNDCSSVGRGVGERRRKKNEQEEEEEEAEEMFIVYMFVLRLDDVQRTEEERTKPRAYSAQAQK